MNLIMAVRIAPAQPSYVLVSNKWGKSVFEKLAALRFEGVLCDVTLQGNDDKQLLAHSSVLAAASSVLKSCLVQAPRGHYVVKIPSISSHIWDLLLSYMYTGKLQALPRDKQELLTASHTLGLAELNGLCNAIQEAPKPKLICFKPSNMNEHHLVTQGEITIVDEPANTSTTANSTTTDDNSGSSSNKYTCITCGKTFPWGRSLLVHELMHKEKKGPKHTCAKCGKTFNSYHSLRAHERTHRYLPFKCEICSAGFHFRVNYEVHKKKVHNIGDDEKFCCEFCDKAFMAIGLLHRHQVTVHKMKRDELEPPAASAGTPQNQDYGGKCEECNIDFETRTGLTYHFKSVHRTKKSIKCSECDKEFKSVFQLREHFAVHSGEPFVKPYKCKYCDKRYLYRNAVMAHEKDAHESYPQQCAVCHLTVKSERILQKHMKLHEGQISEELWKCKLCKNEFSDRPKYALHMAEHRGEKTYYCKYCNKGFPHKGNYSTHMQRHLGIKPFTCKYCGKSFVRKDDMKSHVRVHTGEKPFECQICGMKFAGVSNLREHERAKHNVSFSKRNPVTTPRQMRNKVHRDSKQVEPVDISQEGSLADLADVVTGVLENQGVTGDGRKLVGEQGAASPSIQGTITYVQQPDGTYKIEGQGSYDQLYTVGEHVYQVVMDSGDISGDIKPVLTAEGKRFVMEKVEGEGEESQETEEDMIVEQA